MPLCCRRGRKWDGGVNGDGDVSVVAIWCGDRGNSDATGGGGGCVFVFCCVDIIVVCDGSVIFDVVRMVIGGGGGFASGGAGATVRGGMGAGKYDEGGGLNDGG